MRLGRKADVHRYLVDLVETQFLRSARKNRLHMCSHGQTHPVQAVFQLPLNKLVASPRRAKITVPESANLWERLKRGDVLHAIGYAREASRAGPRAGGSRAGSAKR